MSSTTRMLVLGVIRLFQPVHGYDVRRELVSWHAHEWGNTAPGSIYSALKTLVKEGFIEIVGTDQVGSRPERTTYKMTSRGEQEISELLRDTWWTVKMPIDPLVAGVSLLGFMPREEAISALEARAAQIEGQLKHQQFAIDAIDNVETPDHVREMLRLISARVGAELAWSRAFVARLRAGEYNLLGDAKWQPKPSLADKAAKKPRSVKRKKAPPPSKQKRATAGGKR